MGASAVSFQPAPPAKHRARRHRTLNAQDLLDRAQRAVESAKLRRRNAYDPIEIQLGYPMPSKYRHASTILIPAGGLRAGSSCTTRIREAFGAFVAAHSRDAISRSQAAG